MAISLGLTCMAAMLREATGLVRLPVRMVGAEGLGLAWDRLQGSATLPTQSRAFASALAQTIARDTEVEVFSVPGALLPLCRDRAPFARWRLIGSREVFEPGDALCVDAQAADALAALIARDPRPLELDRIPAGSPFIGALGKAMRGRGLVSVRPATGSPTLPLDETWRDPSARFNSGRRSDFRRAQRRAEASGTVRTEVLSPEPGAFDALFDEAIAVELASWKKEAGTAIAVNPEKEAFFRAFFRAGCEDGTFRIAFLRIDERPVAMQMGLECLGRYWLFKIGYDEAFARCSPGTLLMLHTIGWAAGRGLSAYELLGDVEPWIAEFWTREEHECLRVRTYPFHPRGLWALAQDSLVWLRARMAKSA